MSVLVQVPHLDPDGEQQRADRVVQRALHAVPLSGHGVIAGGLGDGGQPQRGPGLLGDLLQPQHRVVAEVGGLPHRA
jgi:hypothetical protein